MTAGSTEIVLKQIGGYRHCPQTFHQYLDPLFQLLPCVVKEVLWLAGLCVEVNELKHKSEEMTTVRRKLL